MAEQELTARERALLRELAVSAAAGGPLAERFARCGALLGDGAGIDFCALFVCEGTAETVRAAGAWPAAVAPAVPGRTVPAEEVGLSLAAGFAGGEGFRTDDEGASPAAAWLAAAGYGAGWTSPLFERGEPVGMLVAAWRGRRDPGERTHLLLREAAILLGAMAARERELQVARLAAARARAAGELAARLARGEPFETLFASLAEVLPEALPVDYFGLVTRSAEGFVLAGEYPPGVHRGIPPTAEGDAFIERLAARGDLHQFRPEPGASPSDALALAGYGRVALGVLREGDAVAGLFIVARRPTARFDAGEIAFLGLLRAVLSQALTAGAQRRRAEVDASRAKVLNDLAVHLSVGTPLAAVFEELRAKLPQALAFDWVALSVLVPDGTALEVVGAAPGRQLRAGMRFAVEATPSVTLPFDTDGLYQYATAEARTPFGRVVGEAGYRRGLVARLRDGERIVGSLNLARRADAPFTADERAFIATLARLLGLAVGNRRRLEEATRATERAQVLNELALLLNRGEGPEAFFGALSRRLQSIVDFDGLSLWTALDDERLRVVDSLRRRSTAPGYTATWQSFGGLAERRATESVYEAPIEAFEGPLAEQNRAAGVKRAAAVILRHEGREEGLLLLGRTSERPLDAEHVAYLEAVAALLGQALANQRKVRERVAEAVRRQVLSEVAALLEGGRDVREHFEALSGILLQAVGFDLLSVTFRDPVTGDFVPVRSHPLDIDADPQFDEQGLSDVTKAGGIAQYRTADSKRRVPRALHRAGYQRAATAVITSSEGIEGLVTIGRREDEPFDEQEMEFIRLVAALLGQAVANRRTQLRRARQEQFDRVLAEAALFVNDGAPLEQHFERLSQLLLGLPGFDAVVVAARQLDGRFAALRTGSRQIELVDPAEIEQLEAAGVRSIAFGTDDSTADTSMVRRLREAGIVSAAAALLKAGEATVGVLGLGRRERRPFDAEELRFAELLGTLVAYALANRARLERSAAEAEEQRLVAAAAAAVAREGDVLGILRGLRQAVRAFVPQPFAAFGFLEGDSVRFPSEENAKDEILPIGPNFARALAGEVVVVDEPGTAAAAGAMARHSLRREVVAPAYSRGEVVGLLVLGSRDETFVPGEREVRLTAIIADIVGPAMANARATERERREAEDQAVVAAAAAAVARETDPMAVTAALTTVARQFMPAPYVAFGFLDGQVVLFPNRAGSPTAIPIGANFRRALEDGCAVVPPTAERSAPGSALPELDSLGIQAHIIATATSGGVPVGLLVVGSRDPAFRPRERETLLVQLIADIVGPAMANAQAMERERLEAEDQRLLAEVAAVAAREATPDQLVVALQRPLRRLVPLPIVSFGLKEGERIHFPLGDGKVFETEPDLYARLAEESGQTFANELPADLDPRSPLWTMGARAASTTAARAGGRTLGFLVAASRDPDYRFGERALRLLRLIAQIVGPAMENARAAQRAKEDAEEHRFLADVAAVATRARTEEELVREVSREFRGLVPAARLDLLSFDDEGALVSVVAPEVRLPVGFDFPDAHADEPTVREPSEAMTQESRRRQNELGIVQSVTARLASGGRVLGVLWVGTTDPEFRFQPRHVRIIRLAADFLGPALANLQEQRRRIEEAEEQRFLASAAAAAARATNDGEFLAGLRETFGQLVPRAQVDFFYIDGERLTQAGTGEAWPLGPAVRRAIEARQSVDTLDVADILPDNRARIAASGIRRWTTTTASSEGETIGALIVGTPDPDYQFTDRDLRLCRLVADIAGPAMANFRERRRRMEEAEDERIVASVAAASAAARSVAEVVNCLPAILRGRVPGAFAMYGFVRGDGIAYQVTDPQAREVIGEAELFMRFSPVGREALTTGQGVGNLEPFRDSFYGELGLCAYALSSYHAAGGVAGMLMVASREPAYRFSPRDLALLRRITAVVGPVIETVTAQAERDRQAGEQRILAEASAVAATETGPMEILRGLTPVLERFVPEPFVAFGRFDGGQLAWPHLLGGELRLPILPHEDEARRTGQTVVSGEALPELYFGPNFGFSIVSYSAAYSGGEATGLLLVASRAQGHRFSERDLELFRRIAQVTGPAIEASVATRELERQASTYGLILGSLSEAVILLDRQGRTIFANALGRAIVRAIDPERESNDLEAIAERLPGPLRESFRRAFEQGMSASGRAALSVNGEERWFDYEFVPLDHPQLRILTVAADVTEEVRRQAEEAANRARMEQASRLAALGELIGGVAHELNNPLTAILGFAEVLALSDTTGQMSEELGIIQKEALRARNIVRDLLFIARPGSVEQGPVELSEVVGHVQRLRERSWQQANIDVQVRLADALIAWGNEHQLTQVLLNLVTNAEHALEGRPVRRIVIEGDRDASGRIRLTVSDTGTGMDEATRARIFEPFFTTKRQGVGTGLGLPLSYSIVQSHGGTIDCISAPGVGTTFVVTLLPPPETVTESANEAAAPPPARQATILVIDDEPSLRRVCRRLVEGLGHRCLDAEGSEQALVLASEFDPDIVLCDYRLAKETADAVFAGFERRMPHLIPRTIIATGATTDPGVTALIERFGVELLPKPYGIDDIARILRERLGAPGASGAEAPQAGSSG